jgi:hypothetical protein
MVIGRARLRVAAGKTTKLIVKLSRRARAEFRVLTTVKLTLSAVATDSAGHRSATKIRRIILSR